MFQLEVVGGVVGAGLGAALTLHSWRKTGQTSQETRHNKERLLEV